MNFRVLASGARIPARANSVAFLLPDNWNDFFKFETLYSLVIVDSLGQEHVIGGVKIGQLGMESGQRRPDLPRSFEKLDDKFFSLGQDDSYYEDLNGLGVGTRDEVLISLRDMAFNLELFQEVLSEKVTGVSLLRSVMPATVRGQFHRIAHGGARLSDYDFTYVTAKPDSPLAQRAVLEFVVESDSNPPTNIHVLIGRNGVGKTRLLYHMTKALVEDDADEDEVGKFVSENFGPSNDTLFANLVSVTFSAFDEFDPLPTRQNKAKGVQYAYIGLKQLGTGESGKPLPPKNPTRLATEFSRSMLICRQGTRADRWRQALLTLEADPIFKAAEITDLANPATTEEELKPLAKQLFTKLSSGHKVVLLTVTRLVETVEERTLVLLDEPEAHLHPPLLSAFVRALADLLINRNGVAIIATHSPVVLQEVPKSCALKIRRNGSRVDIERPTIETFGENMGILTREVFGLEVTHSGFHKLLTDAVAEGKDFEGVVRKFGGELGDEAKAIVRALVSARDSESSTDEEFR